MLYDPAKQETQLAWSFDGTSPLMQVLQDAEASELYSDSLQGVHSSAPSCMANLPAGHFSQDFSFPSPSSWQM
jgi:hypothetical protein